MKPNRKVMTVLAVVLVVFILLFRFYILPVAREIYSDWKVYKTHVAYRDNYKLHTTPLPQNVVDDICLKLDIRAGSENCSSGVVVYAPELFDEIKTYFENLSDQNKTYHTVHDKIGLYLVKCEQPDLEGDYRCRYDLRGDGVYPVYFYFDKNDFYWQIIANKGGS